MDTKYVTQATEAFMKQKYPRRRIGLYAFQELQPSEQGQILQAAQELKEIDKHGH